MRSPFHNTFASGPLDRGGDQRNAPGFVAHHTGDPAARMIGFVGGEPLLEGAHLARLPLGESTPEIFLGFENGAPLFACKLEQAPPALEAVGLRAAAALIGEADSAIAAAGRSLIHWHERNAFCAACGGASTVSGAGWRRWCAHCKLEHFARVDPVVIMLAIHGRGDDAVCLVGRQSGWPEGRFSALAGFIEPGESLEDACARELFEEAGVRAVRFAYHSSQPWPFPGQLMIAMMAEVSGRDLTLDPAELSEARWLDRASVRAILASEAGHDGVIAPPRLAIARSLLEAFAQERSVTSPVRAGAPSNSSA
ncbi:MAG: NAD(+) diphosphatase [Brevundimonas sp.]|uniref:NAD(+) diphosphatase n=1 Tax=Brevundimonas sp. TaxID=1871086 RepID=UPI00391DBEA3